MNYLKNFLLFLEQILNILGYLKSWAVDPASTNQRFWYRLLGGKLFGKLLGFVFLLAGLFSIYLFFIWK